MKKTTFFFLLLAVVCMLNLKAQTFPIDTILYNGDPGNRVNYIFLSDGYTSSDLSHYKADVTKITNDFLGYTPYKEYKNYFNVFAIRVPSQQSGAKHPKTASDCSSDASNPQTSVNNYFGSSFDVSGIHRLLSVSNSSAVASVMAANFPQYDQIMVLVNTPYYGGAGGSYATFSLHTSASQLCIHEVGHSFAKLADEYWAGPQYAAEKPNMTKETNPSLVKWSLWMNYNNIGIYPHSGDASWKKPHQNCMMEFLAKTFCNVCIETHIERIHALVKPIDAYSPTSLTVNAGSSPLQFSLQLVKPIDNSLKVTWKLDNNAFAALKETVSIDPAVLTTGKHILTATVVDTNQLVRITSHAANHVYKVEWTINKSVTGIDIISTMQAIEVKVFPNPAADFINISYILEENTPVQVRLYDLQGKEVYASNEGKQLPGKYTLQLPLKALGLPAGIYIVNMNFGGSELIEKLSIGE